MKVSFMCPYCDPRTNGQFSLEIPPKNDNVYDISCPNGHTFSANVLVHDFQKLFELAVDALVDERWRDSISNLIASYEKFMELFIRVVMKSNNVNKSVFDENLKHVSRYSERQIGAFVILFTLQFQKKPQLLSNKQSEIRNKVIHQGYFPTQSEAVTFGTDVLKFMRDTLSRIEQSDQLRKELIRSINDQVDWSISGPRVHILTWPLVGTNRPQSQEEMTLAEMVEYMRRVREIEWL